MVELFRTVSTCLKLIDPIATTPFFVRANDLIYTTRVNFITIKNK